MAVGVVIEVCSFVFFIYMLAVVFKKLFAEGPHENLAMKIGLVCISMNLTHQVTQEGSAEVRRKSVRTSVSVKEIFQRVTDAWSLRFVRQRENCESQWLPVLSVLESHCTPSNTN